jgi:histidinol-phosphate phosphatase family protein
VWTGLVAKAVEIGHEAGMSVARQLIILGGGKGTRLASRLNGLPKPLVSVGGVPLLERQILFAKQRGIEKVLVLVNHLAERIQDFLRQRDGFGLDVVCMDDGAPRGTAGAVLAALSSLEENALVMYGDTLLNVDLDRFFAFHEARPDAAATLFLHPNDHPHDSDLVALDETSRITRIFPYPHPEGAEYQNLVNAALYLIRRKALLPWSEAAPPLDFAKDLFPRMLARGQTLYGYRSPEYIKDIGSPERLDKAEADLRSGRVQRACLSAAQAAVLLDRDGTLNKEVGFLSEPEALELLPGASAAVRRLNRAGLLSVVVTNQAVVARGECDEAGLNAIHNRMETLLGREGAYLDRIYACIHHPHKGFPGERPELKIECDCRKPGVGLVDQAVADLHIDRRRSWFVGDRTGDVLCGRRAGLRSVLLRTGVSGEDGKFRVTPDYEFADIEQTVHFILDEHPRLLERLQAFVQDLDPGRLALVGGESPRARRLLWSLLREAFARKGLAVSGARLERFDEERLGLVLTHAATEAQDEDRELGDLQEALADCGLALIEGDGVLHCAQLLCSASLRIFVTCDAQARAEFFQEEPASVSEDRIDEASADVLAHFFQDGLNLSVQLTMQRAKQ